MPVRVFAVEKNPNAIITLRNLNVKEWSSLVTIVSSDMREWKPPVLADIIVQRAIRLIRRQRTIPRVSRRSATTS